MAVVIGAASAVAFWRFHPAAGPRPQRPDTPAMDDARMRERVVGTWADGYKGKRTMTLRPDGTGTMVVEPSGVWSVFASRLRFDMVWSVENGRLKKRTVGGEPALRVRMILETMGDRVDEPILDLTDTRLLLLDGDGKTTYDWRRLRKKRVRNRFFRSGQGHGFRHPAS